MPHRHAHQVTLLALNILKQEAFTLHGETKPFATWEEDMCERSPTFQFWNMIVHYETLILIFVRAHRKKQFAVYVEVLEGLVHLFFILDHPNYARWVPVHIRDLKSLPKPIKEKFERDGNWVVTKTRNKFSAIPIDQAHEQENKNVKSVGEVFVQIMDSKYYFQLTIMSRSICSNVNCLLHRWSGWAY